MANAFLFDRQMFLGMDYSSLLAPIKAPVLRVVGDSEHYYGKRYKSEAQEIDCICINLNNYNRTL